MSDALALAPVPTNVQYGKKYYNAEHKKGK